MTSSAGPTDFGIPLEFFEADEIPFVHEESQPSTSQRAPEVREQAASASAAGGLKAVETGSVDWSFSPRVVRILNDANDKKVYTRTDPHIQLDIRAFRNLMEQEESLQPNYHYFTAVQKELTPFHREQAIDWIYDVARAENCDGDVFLLAVALVDRFLSFQDILKHDIQAVAGVSLFIASKLKAPRPLLASKIVYYTDYTCPLDILLQWELIIVTTLQWETETPTAFSFFDMLAARIPLIHNLRDEFEIVVHKCQRMHKLATLFPSMQCAIGLYYVSNLPNHDPELAAAIKNLLANMFQLEVNLLNSYIPAVQRCLNPSPIYAAEEVETAQAVTVEGPSEEAVASKEEEPTFHGFETPPEQEAEELVVYEEIEEVVEGDEEYIEGEEYIEEEEEVEYVEEGEEEEDVTASEDPEAVPEEEEEEEASAPLSLLPNSFPRLESIPESDQRPSTPLNDSGFSSDASAPSSSEKKRRRPDSDDEDSTPPKVFKFF